MVEGDALNSNALELDFDSRARRARRSRVLKSSGINTGGPCAVSKLLTRA